MKGVAGLIIGLMFASLLLSLAEPQAHTEVEWGFWREKTDPETGEGVKASGFAFTDTMREVVWVKNTGTIPITRIEVKYLTVIKEHKVRNIPMLIVRFLPSECPRERSYTIDLKPGEERKFEETKPFTEWVREDLAYQGMHTIKKWDTENVTVTGDIKKSIISLKDARIDFSQAELYTETELFVNGQSVGKKTFHFRIVKPS